MIFNNKAEIGVKTLFFIVIGIFSMMILFAMFVSYSNLSNNKSAEECDDDCLYQRAYLQDFASDELCNDIENLNLKAKCLREVGIHSIMKSAIDLNKIDLCDNLPNESNLIDICKDNYNMAKFYETENDDYCSMILDIKLMETCLKYSLN